MPKEETPPEGQTKEIYEYRVSGPKYCGTGDLPLLAPPSVPSPVPAAFQISTDEKKVTELKNKVAELESQIESKESEIKDLETKLQSVDDRGAAALLFTTSDPKNKCYLWGACNKPGKKDFTVGHEDQWGCTNRNSCKIKSECEKRAKSLFCFCRNTRDDQMVYSVFFDKDGNGKKFSFSTTVPEDVKSLVDFPRQQYMKQCKEVVGLTDADSDEDEEESNDDEPEEYKANDEEPHGENKDKYETEQHVEKRTNREYETGDEQHPGFTVKANEMTDLSGITV